MIFVLRLSHRLPRDERITTHVALVARAFLSNKFFYSGQKDKGLEESIHKVNLNWGGHFEIEYIDKPIHLIKSLKKTCLIVHLTMYGEKVLDVIDEIKEKQKNKDLLIIVGGEKVPREIYHLADYNVSITNQPHSEVSSLAIFLNKVLEDLALKKDLFNGKLKIIPSKHGKKVLRK